MAGCVCVCDARIWTKRARERRKTRISQLYRHGHWPQTLDTDSVLFVRVFFFFIYIFILRLFLSLSTGPTNISMFGFDSPYFCLLDFSFTLSFFVPFARTTQSQMHFNFEMFAARSCAHGPKWEWTSASSENEIVGEKELMHFTAIICAANA